MPSALMAQRHANEPWVEVVEQPKTTAMRFRYQCEGRSAGTILGVSATAAQKTYPTIKIHNCGPAAVVVVSCVTQNPPHYPHPHSLIGTNCSDAVCTLRIKGKDCVTMMNVGIQCCKRNEVKNAIEQRQNIRVDPFGTGYVTDLEKLDLSAVRLCFQVFLPDQNRKFTRVVEPVVSDPIIDKKLVNSLTICRLSKRASTADGGDEVLMLCDKIKKDDIEVRFYEEDTDGEVIWESFGTFTGSDVHHQCAIAFKTPAYRDRTINGPVTVQVQLRRPSDFTSGHSKEFQYIPNDITAEDSLHDGRRRRIASRTPSTHQLSETAAATESVAKLTTYYEDYQRHSSMTTNNGHGNNNGGVPLPLSVIQNDELGAECISPPAPAAHQVIVSSGHAVPIDFSSAATVQSWQTTNTSTSMPDDVKSEEAQTEESSESPQVQYLENGAILLNQTEDGRLVLPPGFRIILPDGQELSGALDGNLVMAYQQPQFPSGFSASNPDHQRQQQQLIPEIYKGMETSSDLSKNEVQLSAGRQQAEQNAQ